MSNIDLYKLTTKELVQFCKDNNVPGHSYHCGNYKHWFTDYVKAYLEKHPDRTVSDEIVDTIKIVPVTYDPQEIKFYKAKRHILFALLHKIPCYWSYRTFPELQEFIIRYSDYSHKNEGKVVKKEIFRSPNYNKQKNFHNSHLFPHKPLTF